MILSAQSKIDKLNEHFATEHERKDNDMSKLNIALFRNVAAQK